MRLQVSPHRTSLCAVVVVLACTTIGTSTAQPDRLRELYDTRDWFALRAAVWRTSPPLYHAAVAAAFNRVADAERHVQRAIREARDPRAANEVRGLLAVLYLRLGRIGDAGRAIDDFLRIEPERSDLRTLQSTFGAFSGRPNQTVVRQQANTFSCSVSRRAVHLPLLVNGTRVRWQLDTGAIISVVSESDARLVGLSPRDAGTAVGDLAGGQVSARFVLADRVRVGGTELQHVPMLVLPDGEPWLDAPAGERGAIGLPLATALRSIRWTSGGRCSTTTARVGGGPTLTFDQLALVIRADYSGRPLTFQLDTGNGGGTQLWERFGREYEHLLTAQGTKATKRVTQIGGANDRDIVRLPSLALGIGKMAILLQPAEIFRLPVGDEVRWGNLGMDALSQAREITLDFQSMNAELRR